tara:strand:+ start:255 stop:509 length:255 start_codon:yes stop_codon:yes gene_type:complete
VLFDAARKGDSTANEIINAAADMHGIGIVNLLHLYSPEILIFGGGLAHGFDTLADGIQTVSSAPPCRHFAMFQWSRPSWREIPA